MVAPAQKGQPFLLRQDWIGRSLYVLSSPLTKSAEENIYGGRKKDPATPASKKTKKEFNVPFSSSAFRMVTGVSLLYSAGMTGLNSYKAFTGREQSYRDWFSVAFALALGGSMEMANYHGVKIHKAKAKAPSIFNYFFPRLAKKAEKVITSWMEKFDTDPLIKEDPEGDPPIARVTTFINELIAQSSQDFSRVIQNKSGLRVYEKDGKRYLETILSEKSKKEGEEDPSVCRDEFTGLDSYIGFRIDISSISSFTDILEKPMQVDIISVPKDEPEKTPKVLRREKDVSIREYLDEESGLLKLYDSMYNPSERYVLEEVELSEEELASLSSPGSSEDSALSGAGESKGESKRAPEDDGESIATMISPNNSKRRILREEPPPAGDIFKIEPDDENPHGTSGI